jgi:hypothetical protein
VIVAQNGEDASITVGPASTGTATGMQLGALAFAAVLTGTLGLLLKPVSNETTGEDAGRKRNRAVPATEPAGFRGRVVAVVRALWERWAAPR